MEKFSPFKVAFLYFGFFFYTIILFIRRVGAVQRKNNFLKLHTFIFQHIENCDLALSLSLFFPGFENFESHFLNKIICIWKMMNKMILAEADDGDGCSHGNQHCLHEFRATWSSSSPRQQLPGEHGAFRPRTDPWKSSARQRGGGVWILWMYAWRDKVHQTCALQ